MKAIVYEKFGPPEVLKLKEVEKPIPGNDEVLIRIHASTVNRTDCGFRNPDIFIVRFFAGFFKPKKKILGSEFAGEIEETGKDVITFKKGDRVFGLSTKNFGTHAEYISLPEKGPIEQMPSNMSYEQAAAVCDGLMLANNYIREIDFKSAREILINGASGSIGSACVQLAKYYGTEVTAVCNTKYIELLKSLGADHVIDYTKEDFTQRNEQYDIVLDAVGKSTFFRCRRIIKPGGIYFSTDLGPFWQNIWLPLITKFFGSRKVMFPLPNAEKEDIRFFKEIIEAGKYKAVIDTCYQLDQIIEATKYVERGEKKGNVVISIKNQE